MFKMFNFRGTLEVSIKQDLDFQGLQATVRLQNSDLSFLLPVFVLAHHTNSTPQLWKKNGSPPT